MLIIRLCLHMFHSWLSCAWPVPRVIITRVIIGCMALDESHETCIFHATRKCGPRSHITLLRYSSFPTWCSRALEQPLLDTSLVTLASSQNKLASYFEVHASSASSCKSSLLASNTRSRVTQPYARRPYACTFMECSSQALASSQQLLDT